MIEPIELTNDTVVLRRGDYDALIEAYEEVADVRALAEVRAREAAGEAEYVPIELADRIFAGEHPVRVWRGYRGLTLSALAKTADIAPSYLSEIEAGKKPGSAQALAALAKVLRVDVGDVLTTTGIKRRSRRDPSSLHVEKEAPMPAAEQEAGTLQHLTPRERKVLAHLAEGKSNKMIARELAMSEDTVKVLVRRMLIKLRALNRTELARRLTRAPADPEGAR